MRWITLLFRSPAPPVCRKPYNDNRGMTDTQLLQEFEALAERLDIPVTYANLEGGAGGLCVVKGKRRFILNRGPDVRTHIEIFAREFARLSLDDVYIRPLVRERIDEVRPAYE